MSFIEIRVVATRDEGSYWRIETSVEVCRYREDPPGQWSANKTELIAQASTGYANATGWPCPSEAIRDSVNETVDDLATQIRALDLEPSQVEGMKQLGILR